MGRGECVLGKKGMSPLIATVLLMAFAVALGGMIMNWSVDKGTGGDCDSINVKVVQFCTKSDRIQLSMRNDPGGVRLVGIKLGISESSIESSLRIKDSALQPGQPLEISVPAATTSATRVDIIGVVGSDANPISCTVPIATADPIAPCPQ